MTFNYSNGLIYKIVCNDVNITDIYVGSCCNFRRRKTAHKTCCNNKKSKNYNFKIYQTIRANGGWQNWSMLEVEKYSCNDKRELELRERHWLEQLKANLNCNIPSRTQKERKKQYYEENKNKINEKQKQYNEKNKNKILEYKKNKYLANKLYEFIYS